ncbi:syntaxin 2 [Aphelenchoides avenae]|nr:syntaxin 2 [Aphelenchus avenae]
MVRDRLSELKRQAEQPAVLQVDPVTVAYDTGARLSLFHQHVDELKQSIEQLQNRIHNLQTRQAAVLSQPVVNPGDKERLEALIVEIRQHTRSLRPRITQIEEDLRRDEAARPEYRTGAEYRIRKNQCEMLKNRLNDILMLFNQAQVEYKQRVSRRVKTQMAMAGTHMSPQEVDDMLESKSDEIFYRQINPISMAARLAVEDAANRHREILKLEESISELQDIFQDIFHMVDSQNALVNNIAKNVEDARDYTHETHVHLTQAKKYKKASNRKKIILVLLLVMLLALLALVIVLSLGLGGSKNK